MSIWVPTETDVLCDKLDTGEDLGSAEYPVIFLTEELDHYLRLASAFGYELHTRAGDEANMWTYAAFIKPVARPFLRLVK